MTYIAPADGSRYKLCLSYSGVPPYPPPSVAAAGQLINNPVMSAAALHYGSELAQRSQAYVDQGVSREDYSCDVCSVTGVIVLCDWCDVCSVTGVMCAL